MRHFFIISLSLISNLINSTQPDSTVLDLTGKYIRGELGDYRSVLTGEAKEQDFNPKKISKNAEVSYEILLNNNNRAVIAIAIKENENYTDLYAFWTKDKEWKISAFRALWLPGMFYMMLDKYKDLDEAGVQREYEKMFMEVKRRNDFITDEKIIESIGSLEDFRYEIKNMKLTVAPDKELIEHFNNNQERFSALLASVLEDTLSAAQSWRFGINSPYRHELQGILISSVSGSGKGACIKYQVGGMIDNSVGYFHCEDPDNVPEMSDNRYIMIRYLGNGWYLYKTT